MKKLIIALLFGVSTLFTSVAAMAQGATHKIAIHVDQNDKKVMNMALNNAQNVMKYYRAKGDKVELEIVAYGPGLHMFRADTSPVKSRLATMKLEIPNLKFSACGNTQRKMAKKSGKKIVLVDEANLVPSGVVRLVELQEQGFAYIRP